MKKSILFVIALFFFVNFAVGQEYATNFTVADCNGDMHDLFTELDEGKVIIIAWVMPCASCIEDPAIAFGLSEAYESSIPGKVLFYMADDYANTDCSTLQTWASNYGMGKSTIFSNEAISMSDYGQDGMPKIVVLGGGGAHKVYYNKNFTSEGIEEAIELAIAESDPVGTENVLLNYLSLNTFPNPARDLMFYEFTLLESAQIQLEVVSMAGEVVTSIEESYNNPGTYKSSIDVSSWAQGSYILKFIIDGETRSHKFFVSQE